MARENRRFEKRASLNFGLGQNLVEGEAYAAATAGVPVEVKAERVAGDVSTFARLV